MKKSRFTEEQIVFALKQAELGTSVSEASRLLNTDYILSSATHSSIGLPAGSVTSQSLQA